jgi:hypothetical protein
MTKQMAGRAVRSARGYLSRDAGDIFAVSAEARTLAKTIDVLNRWAASEGPSAAEEKRLADLILEVAEELDLVEACQLLIDAVTRGRN